MAAKLKSPHPSWATKHRTPGTELRLLDGRYYLYGYKTEYDKERKKPKKVSLGILGRITQKDGLVPSGKRKLETTLNQTVFKHIHCKEYGMARLVEKKFAIYNKVLKEVFGDMWTDICAIAYCRFVYRCPLKSIGFRLEQSYLPELLGVGSYNEKKASGILKQIGQNHPMVISYMKSFIGKSEYLLMDATDIFSNSQLIPIARKGYNHKLNFDGQFNLMYIYSAQSHMPVFYRLLPGNIREVKAFKNSLLEAGLQDAVIVADKGFYSRKNIELLQQEKLKFILPLKRDNPLIDYAAVQNNSFKTKDSFFKHENRIIWFRNQIVNDMSLSMFVDESLKLKEETDYLIRIETHPESYSIDQYHERRNRFGTIALLTNLKKTTAQETYQSYKTRNSIEVMFDGMKNINEADHTYMQDEQTLQGWMFINHITLQWYQHLYLELKQKELLKKISVNDYIQYLTDVKKIYINNTWHQNEVTSHTLKLIEKTGFALD